MWLNRLKKETDFLMINRTGSGLITTSLLLHAIPNIQQTFVSYDSFIDDWELELKRCAAGLGIAWPEDDSRLKEGMAAFVRPDLRHSISGIGELKKHKAPKPVIKLYKLLDSEINEPFIHNTSLFSEAEKLLKDFLLYTCFFEYDMSKPLGTWRKIGRA